MTALNKFSSFTDLADHYAEAVAAPDYGTAFMEQTDMAQMSIAQEPTSDEMPDPDVAQAAMEMIMATTFDLFRGTRMEEFASEIAWGIANSFHMVAKRVDGRADDTTMKLKDLIAHYDPSEIYAVELEETTMRARSLDEARDALECMRDHAAKIYMAETGRPFSPTRGSKVSSKSTASLIESRDFLAARAANRREQYAPSGAVVLFSGGQQWGETKDIEETLDYVKARVPSMVLATTAQNAGADVIAQAWAARNEVQVVMCRLDRRLGNRAGFARNDRMLGMNPVEAVVCSGSGIQMNLADKLRKAGVPLTIVREASRAAA